eukprot:CCRYP_008527-RA/>CCRYP_008527-RA protein AED:0.86 eAED:1.00 QI:0/-1/0/1/-1/1/1/0/86
MAIANPAAPNMGYARIFMNRGEYAMSDPTATWIPKPRRHPQLQRRRHQTSPLPQRQQPRHHQGPTRSGSHHVVQPRDRASHHQGRA